MQRASALPQNVKVVSAEGFTDAVARRALACLEEDTTSVGLSGGRTPGPIYSLMAASTLFTRDHPRVYQTDERSVGPGSTDSNFGLIERSLGACSASHDPSIERMLGEADDLEAAAQAYARVLPDRLALVLLGLGEDGHIASVFPGDEDVWTCPDKATVTTSPRGDYRLTLSPRYLLSARRIIVFATGGNKAAAVRRAYDPASTPLDLPAAAFREASWILDQSAAAGLLRP